MIQRMAVVVAAVALASTLAGCGSSTATAERTADAVDVHLAIACDDLASFVKLAEHTTTTERPWLVWDALLRSAQDELAATHAYGASGLAVALAAISPQNVSLGVGLPAVIAARRTYRASVPAL